MLYITYLEDIFTNGVFRSQVINLLKKMRQVDNSKRIILLSFVPFYHIFTRHKKITNLKSELAKIGIKLKVAPALIRNRWMNKEWTIALLLCLSVPVTGYLVLRRRVDIIHARSYPATLIGLITKKLLKRTLIFDMRGLYPEEGILAGYWREESAGFKRWKRIEKILIEQADCVVVVSESFAEHIYALSNQAKIAIIVCCVDIELFRHQCKYRLKLRQEYNLNSKFVVIYCGSFSRWTGGSMLAKIFKALKTVKTDAFFLIATRDKTTVLERYFAEEEISRNDYLIVNVEWFDIPKLLTVGDVGILVRKDSIVNQVSCPVKFAEYMAGALPAIVSSNTTNIAELVETHKVGVTIDFDNLVELQETLKHFFNSYGKLRLNCLRLAENYFSIIKIAHQYLQLYFKLNNS